MTYNHFFNANNLSINSSFGQNKNQSESFQDFPLYPKTPNFNLEGDNFKSKEIDGNSKNSAPAGNLASLMQLMSIFSSKKTDLSALLSSPIGKSLGINENMASMLSLLGNKKGKTQNSSAKETLPKIDSLERTK